MSYITELIDAGDRLFGKRENLLMFWQDVAEQFAPDLADFTVHRPLGTDYASDLFTSYPLLVARELADHFGMMLRPTQKPAAEMIVHGLQDHEGKQWLEWATKIQQRFMYDRAAQYVTTAKQGERDFSLFGQAPMSIEVMPNKTGLLFRSWSLRDTVWCDGVACEVEAVHRNWRPTAWELARVFGKERLHERVRDCLERQAGKNPYQEIHVRHLVVPRDQYQGEQRFLTPLVSCYIDVDNRHIIEARGVRSMSYVIPRWQRIRGTQYAVSPAVVCALPEARLLQAMTYTLLQAGEKAVDPPLIATEGAVRNDIDVRAGGITWVAADYDERNGGVLRPIHVDKNGIPFGLEMQQRSEMMLRRSFFADKLTMPQRGGPQETAYEVGQRVQQYIREALPLVEPIEIEFNGGVWERAFDVLLNEGAFGAPADMPKSLRGAEVEFKFSSPLREQADSQKGRVFLDGVQLLQAGAAIDPAVASIPNAVETMRDVLQGIGWEAKWMHSPEEVQAAADEQTRQAQSQAMLDAMTQASGVAKNLKGVEVPSLPAEVA